MRTSVALSYAPGFIHAFQDLGYMPRLMQSITIEAQAPKWLLILTLCVEGHFCTLWAVSVKEISH